MWHEFMNAGVQEEDKSEMQFADCIYLTLLMIHHSNFVFTCVRCQGLLIMVNHLTTVQISCIKLFVDM